MAFTVGYKARAGRSRGANTNQGRGSTKPRKGGTLGPLTASPRAGKPGLVGATPPPKPGASKPAPKPVGRSAQPDSIYDDRVDFVERRKSHRLSELDASEQSLKHDFGIDDPTNPFSRAEGLKRAFLTRYRGRSAGLAAQGQVYSGAHERAMSRTRREEEEANANLRRAYDEGLAEIGRGRAGVEFDAEEDRTQAYADWLARAPASEAAAPAKAGAGGSVPKGLGGPPRPNGKLQPGLGTVKPKPKAKPKAKKKVKVGKMGKLKRG